MIPNFKQLTANRGRQISKPVVMVGPSRSCDNTDVDVMGQGEKDGLSYFMGQEDFREMMPFSALNLHVIVVIINGLPRLGHFRGVFDSSLQRPKKWPQSEGPSQLTLWLSSKGTIHLSQGDWNLPCHQSPLEAGL